MAIFLSSGPDRRWARAGALVWLLAGACGGTTTLSACAADADCANGLICLRGECTSSALTCDKNACPNRMDCVEHECRWRCVVTDDCPAGANCRAGHCSWPSCTAHTDCAAGKACVEGECVTATCRENVECGTDGICRAGTCIAVGECLINDHCHAGQTCVNGICQGVPIPVQAIPCRINAECGENGLCIGGICRWGVECLAHADCPAGRACFLSVCWDT